MRTDPIEKLVAHLIAEGEHTRDALRALMQATDRGRRLQGARVLPVPAAGAATSGTLLWGGAGRLMGWTLRNSTGTGSLVVNLYDGNDNGGQLVATTTLAATPQPPAWFGPSGLSVTEKLSVEVIPTGGALLAGVVYYGATD